MKKVEERPDYVLETTQDCLYPTRKIPCISYLICSLFLGLILGATSLILDWYPSSLARYLAAQSENWVAYLNGAASLIAYQY